ncbi:13366_t:CDS:2 [Gigaspora margarita]|uniref:13366_t:CDS:1 n=1 Tax=Gigaspora margarita TaxID=4874 RepID=A0ABN7UHY5_GIGMA|nr:13366_t:CDS:2 [Gigaspora margarita]
MVDAQAWLDQNYPENGTCMRVEDKENYGKNRNLIVNLDISNQNLKGPLKLNKDLDQSHNQLKSNNFALPNSPNATSNSLASLDLHSTDICVRFDSTLNITPTSSSFSTYFPLPQPQQSTPTIPYSSEVLLV